MTLRPHGAVVDTGMTLAMLITIMILIVLLKILAVILTTLVLDLILKLHGCRNLDITLMVVTVSLKPTKIRKRRSARR